MEVLIRSNTMTSAEGSFTFIFVAMVEVVRRTLHYLNGSLLTYESLKKDGILENSNNLLSIALHSIARSHSHWYEQDTEHDSPNEMPNILDDD